MCMCSRFRLAVVITSSCRTMSLITSFPFSVWPSSYSPILFYAFLYSWTKTTHAESINSDLQRGLDRRLRHTHTTLNTEQNQLAIKVSAHN